LKEDEYVKRLTLTPVAGHHAEDLYPILAEPALYHFTGGQPPENMESVQNWFSALETRKSPDGTQEWLTWIVHLKTLDTPVGYVQATVTGAEAEIAWLIGTTWQGQGYAKEAVAMLVSSLKELEVKRLTAHIHPDHRASQSVATSVGLVRTGDYHEGEEIWAASLEPA
jgi:RimJ/RimL family protein N-acetyltransferase